MRRRPSTSPSPSPSAPSASPTRRPFAPPTGETPAARSTSHVGLVLGSAADAPSRRGADELVDVPEPAPEHLAVFHHHRVVTDRSPGGGVAVDGDLAGGNHVLRAGETRHHLGEELLGRRQ